VSDRFPGKHTGLVTDNDDPLALGRVRAQVPDVLGDLSSGWCLPSSPYAGDGIGFAAVPAIGAIVHVEWPAGDLTRVPIWSGCAWSNGAGVSGAGPDTVLLVTAAGHRIALDDTGGSESLEIEAASGAKVALSGEGVSVEFGSQKLEMTRASISLNGGALEVR
jgi:uncharacterized protein involved in type VI secretion and phage assembly